VSGSSRDRTFAAETVRKPATAKKAQDTYDTKGSVWSSGKCKGAVCMREKGRKNSFQMEARLQWEDEKLVSMEDWITASMVIFRGQKANSNWGREVCKKR
jgi:hypothetical protein